MDSDVVRVTPPKMPLLGDGLTKALGSLERFGIRVLSPKREPRKEEKVSVGNTAEVGKDFDYTSSDAAWWIYRETANFMAHPRQMHSNCL